VGICVVGLGEGLGDGEEEVGAIDVGAVMAAAVVLLDDEHAASPAVRAIKPARTAKFLMISPSDTSMTLRWLSRVTRACRLLLDRHDTPFRTKDHD
jgi:hypothetical protein